MIEFRKIAKEEKIYPISIPKVVLYSKSFKETIFFNCLHDFEMHMKCSSLSSISHYLFYRYRYNLIGITNNLDDLSAGDIIYIDKSTKEDIIFYNKLFDKSLYLNKDFQETLFYPTIKEIDIKITFSEEDKKERRLNVTIGPKEELNND